MLEKVDLKKVMMKEEYKQVSAGLKERLTQLQQSIKANRLPVIILFEGWGASGKGTRIADLILNLDPRYFSVTSFIAPDEAERRKPLLWRYWNKIPAQGQMAIYDRSWYQDISVAKLEEDITEEEIVRRTESIKTFERQLSDDGYLIIKFFLHISKKDQKERFEKLLSSKNTAWQVTKKDLKRNKEYDRYYEVLDEMLENTSTEYAPWHVVSSHDKNSCMADIYSIVVSAIEKAVAKKREDHHPLPVDAPVILSPNFRLLEMPKLADIDLNRTLTDETYKEQLKKQQEKLSVLHNKIYKKQIPVIVAYEGWDAAGKGGNIRRVAAALDPRGYEAIPIAAPDKYELAHHYLWRFWRNIPKTGHLAIFDRTWYGRVMVERIEGFCTSEEWHRAYQEINEFEKELSDWGAIIVKFWLHIDGDEQLRRFTERQNTPSKQWKITEEDWRNREKWPQYEEAVDDMLRYTSTDFAPWNIIESNDKKFARIKALRTLNHAIELRL
ncbi:polyphosphate:AMP phosphotransferase [Zongyangia hominis]|uniref:Polyphosphate:AMP phosphotransferase n=1 Tax=Zongyangia hominis TaxID=2763677 RepID=A0A926IBD6_9FIRM|nr:polyphosphate:AMP phosphotransferase [Zongyangia hominis]MBC8571126.1 polyphosphate:AMP phosphotransferase [Zongyangia hominis]